MTRVQAALLYTAVALFMLYPAWTSPSHGVVADWTHPDALGNHWLYQWTAETLASGGSILHNDRYYWPVGDAPFLAGNGSDAVPFTLLGAWLDWPFSVTLWCLLTIVLNGLGGFAIAEAVGVTGGGAIVTGAMLVFCPYVVRELSAGRFAQAGLWTAAFFLAAWIRLLDAPSWKRGALAGVLFSLTAFQYWYYGLWMAVAGALFWAFRPSIAPLLRFVPFALAGTLPPLLLFLTNWTAIPGVDEATFPHPISVEYALFAGFPVWSGTGELASLGLPILLTALAAAGWRSVPKPLARGAVAAALVFYALSLGPELLVQDGKSSEIPGPFQVVYRWSATLQRFWWPYRHLAPLTLVLLPLAARGAERLVRWLNLPMAALLVVGLLPVELYARGAVVEVSTSWFTAPKTYQALAEQPAGNVLELPLYEKIARNESSLSYQRVHQKTLINGHAMWVDRVRPAAWNVWIAEQPLLHALRQFEAGTLTGQWALTPGQTPWETGAVAYISLNREYFPGELGDLLDHHATFLTAWYGKPMLKGGGVRVWDVRGLPPHVSYFWPKWSPPSDYVTASGLASLPDAVNPAGWLNWPRGFPPAPPEARSTTFDEELRNSRLPAALRRRLEREASPDDTGEAP